MKRYSIKVNNQYLSGFEENETYVKNARSIQSTLHDASEYNPVLQDEQMLFDGRTCTGYITTLIECIRWNGLETNKIELEVTDV